MPYNHQTAAYFRIYGFSPTIQGRTERESEDVNLARNKRWIKEYKLPVNIL